MTDQPALHTVILFTTRMAELAEFYRQGLELGQPQSSPGHLGFLLDNVYLGFDQVDEQPARGGGTTLWFAVADLDVTFQRFVSLGADVRYAPVQKPWGATLASLVDPDGNIFGLVQQSEAGDR
ncbi:MAG: VOC family protein [Candidatus Promineifilaceae bacterium]|nr:VOC family protein [Candidatus Promineifilaceae bacterium]